MVWELAPTCTVRVVGVAAASKVDRIRGSFNDNGIALPPRRGMIALLGQAEPRHLALADGTIEGRPAGLSSAPDDAATPAAQAPLTFAIVDTEPGRSVCDRRAIDGRREHVLDRLRQTLGGLARRTRRRRNRGRASKGRQARPMQRLARGGGGGARAARAG